MANHIGRSSLKLDAEEDDLDLGGLLTRKARGASSTGAGSVRPAVVSGSAAIHNNTNLPAAEMHSKPEWGADEDLFHGKYAVLDEEEDDDAQFFANIASRVSGSKQAMLSDDEDAALAGPAPAMFQPAVREPSPRGLPRAAASSPREFPSNPPTTMAPAPQLHQDADAVTPRHSPSGHDQVAAPGQQLKKQLVGSKRSASASGGTCDSAVAAAEDAGASNTSHQPRSAGKHGTAALLTKVQKNALAEPTERVTGVLATQQPHQPRQTDYQAMMATSSSSRERPSQPLTALAGGSVQPGPVALAQQEDQCQQCVGEYGKPLLHSTLVKPQASRQLTVSSPNGALRLASHLAKPALIVAAPCPPDRSPPLALGKSVAPGSPALSMGSAGKQPGPAPAPSTAASPSMYLVPPPPAVAAPHTEPASGSMPSATAVNAAGADTGALVTAADTSGLDAGVADEPVAVTLAPLCASTTPAPAPPPVAALAIAPTALPPAKLGQQQPLSVPEPVLELAEGAVLINAGSLRQLEMMLVGAQEVRAKLLEVRVQAAVWRNQLVRLDNPMLRARLASLAKLVQQHQVQQDRLPTSGPLEALTAGTGLP